MLEIAHCWCPTSPWEGFIVKAHRLVIVATALVLATGTAPSAAGGTDTIGLAARAPVRAQLLLNFDNGESLRPGTVVRNVGSAGGAGRVLVAGGRLRVVPGFRGRGALFPRAGRVIIEVPDRRAFDPGRAGFRFGSAVRISPRRANRRSNIVQKGYHGQAGGQYKLQLDFGRASCVVRGRRGRVIARARTNVADRRWHTVTCQRRPGQVILRIDGRVRARAGGNTGYVANEAPVRVGGRKVASGPSDQYRGRLDGVFVRINR